MEAEAETKRHLPRTERWIIDEVYKALDLTDKLLNALQIPYTMIGGTLLGAVRHGGMIPWDDDADLSIRSRDVPLLLRESKDFLRKHRYGLSDSGFYLKIYSLSNPQAQPVDRMDPDYFHRPFVDIYPMANLRGRWVFSSPAARNRWPEDFFEADDFDHLRRRRFGPLSLSSVSDEAAHRYLSAVYGKNWSTQPTFYGFHTDNDRSIRIVGSDSFEPALPSSWSPSRERSE